MGDFYETNRTQIHRRISFGSRKIKNVKRNPLHGTTRVSISQYRYTGKFHESGLFHTSHSLSIYNPSETSDSLKVSGSSQNTDILDYLEISNKSSESSNTGFSDLSIFPTEEHADTTLLIEDPTTSDVSRKKCLLRIFAVILVMLVCAVIPGLLAYYIQKNEEAYQTTVDLNIRVNDTYQAGMENTSSEVFLEYQDKFCNLNNSLSISKWAVLESCQITQLSNGSVIIRSWLTLITRGKPSENFTDMLFKGEDDSSLKWGSFNVISYSINNQTTEKYQDISLLSQTCSPEKEWDVLPLHDTYPHNCGQFQLCRNGIATLLTCKSGLEFTFSDSSTCAIPSSSTYCGKRRYQDFNPSASTPTTSTTLAKETTAQSTITSGASITTSTEGVTTRTSSSTTTSTLLTTQMANQSTGTLTKSSETFPTGSAGIGTEQTTITATAQASLTPTGNISTASYPTGNVSTASYPTGNVSTASYPTGNISTASYPTGSSTTKETKRPSTPLSTRIVSDVTTLSFSVTSLGGATVSSSPSGPSSAPTTMETQAHSTVTSSASSHISASDAITHTTAPLLVTSSTTTRTLETTRMVNPSTSIQINSTESYSSVAGHATTAPIISRSTGSISTNIYLSTSTKETTMDTTQPEPTSQTVIRHDSTSSLPTESSGSDAYTRESSFTTTPTTRFTSGTTTSNRASCSDSTNTYLPKTDTYPYKCNQFIECVSGSPVERCCAPGLYFSFFTNISVCDWPSSNNTYCGIMQNGRKENNTTSAACNSTASTNTTNDNTTLSFPINVTSLLFTCNVSVGRQFIPTLETYPNNCDKYTDCVSGIPHNQTCAPGTHFTPYPDRVCDHINSTYTYCALRRDAETSYNLNVLTTNPGSP